MKKPLNTPVRFLKGIGPKRAKNLNNLGINTLEDVLYYFPRRYEDRTNLAPVARLKEGQIQTIRVQVISVKSRRSFRRRGFSIVEIAVADATGKISCVWFNQPYLGDYFKVKDSVILYGKVERYSGRLQMNSPEFEVISEGQDESLNIGRIVPIYALPQGITQRYFRSTVNQVLKESLTQVSDFLSYDMRSRNNLLNLARSLMNIHFPENPDLQKEAYRRLSFEEFFIFQVPFILRKTRKSQKTGIAHDVTDRLTKDFIDNLPFKLTRAQEKAISEIKADMAKPLSMQRLLQGDVGSGKTVVATMAVVIAVQGGFQAAVMVPTEILARQHYEKIGSQFAVCGSQLKKIKLALLTSSATDEEKRKIYEQLKKGRLHLVIGTHALLEEKMQFKNLGLVVVDEQHKFGVGQRSLLPKKGANPDVLIMTATPIPRTLAITLYGDLDISVINELPAGRMPVKTLHFAKGEELQAYAIAREELKIGNQAYIIYPVIEESYALDIAGAKKMYEKLKKREFKEFRVGLIHGRLKQKEQDEIMKSFKEKKLDILVSTTVLEVGIDIPGATCMIIEHAERFGLAQLHQLRGRIGRGNESSVCMLISGSTTEEAGARIEAMLNYNDGFKIAEVDLRIRGPGEFFGSRQHGLTELKIGNPLTQMQLLKKAREEAVKLLALDPYLDARPNQQLKEKLLQRFPEYEKLMLVA